MQGDFLQHAGFFVQLVVAVVEHQVGSYHHEVQNVEKQHVPFAAFGQQLGRDAADVAEKDQQKKGETLALGGAGLPGFDDVHRPGKTKADDHADLQEFRHDIDLLFLAQMVLSYQKIRRL